MSFCIRAKKLFFDVIMALKVPADLYLARLQWQDQGTVDQVYADRKVALLV
jgi:hypothetical protein